ncbi:tetratricopeptide repeat protein [Tetragenococcus halophilus]|uniref:Tetratricopeptide repeat protein n=1 Tax=Tetragenococcus halophilus (strain DSM 20338 / JCM 20259 / NCIMB 9735 / NBRC 12172) TaxID=945021 RepID=A0AAN1SHW6_TETHN|nr:tetratricopeptide repeat protein [Tetragenococcus halophilus]MDN6291646.1 tetratricopeptide repeat protein [Tetragenococcus halophilus]NRR75561.1 tetratricopeptide repeat protein [Tetragenococcus halophilus]NWN99810.1 tetratricopeptide repeat protein [Tetragenococcus halophilus]QXN87466.1 tetratricopeptide repeat protein [Tetragenococcus halophilus]RQD33257.1 tetratricopeptide repeat protein [Tetragenococcus halophilus subsp. halophilus DSM 20339]
MTYSEKMLDALDQEDFAEAQLQLNQAIKEDNEDILEELGESLLSIGFLEEAKQVFENLKSRHPEQKENNLPLAEIAVENNETDAALELLEEIGSDSELYPQALLVTADLYQVLGIPEVSESKLKEASRILPDEPLIQFALAELYLSMDRFNEAAFIYQHLLELGEEEINNVSIKERLGTTLSLEGDFENAAEYLEASLEEGETDERLFQTAFVYRQLKDNDKSIRYLQELRELNPQYRALYLPLAESLQEEELVEEAQTVIEEGIQENPYQVDLYHFASENSYRLHDAKKAEDYLLQALELGEKTEETLLTLSNLYINEERFEEAIKTVKQMEDTQNPYALWNLAHAYNELEDFEQAGQYYEQASVELKHEPDFMKEYGIFLREEGRLEEAKSYLSHYLEHEPGDMEAESILDDLSERW